MEMTGACFDLLVSYKGRPFEQLEWSQGCSPSGSSEVSVTGDAAGGRIEASSGRSN